MISGREDIINYIPQREPMLLVHRLLEHSDKLTMSGFDIEERNILVHNGYLSEAGLLENMAQTAALSKGYECAQKNQKPPIGFIGAVKNLKVQQLPEIGKQIQTHIVPKHEVLNASIVDATVFCDAREIASCELKIFINPEI